MTTHRFTFSYQSTDLLHIHTYIQAVCIELLDDWLSIEFCQLFNWTTAAQLLDDDGCINSAKDLLAVETSVLYKNIGKNI